MTSPELPMPHGLEHALAEHDPVDLKIYIPWPRQMIAERQIDHTIDKLLAPKVTSLFNNLGEKVIIFLASGCTYSEVHEAIKELENKTP